MSKQNHNGNGLGSKPDETSGNAPELSEAEKAKQLQDQKEALAELEKAEAEKAESDRLEAERLQKEAEDKAALENLPVKSEAELELELLISTIEDRKEYRVSAIETKSGFKKDKEYKVSGNVVKVLLKKGLVTLI